MILSNQISSMPSEMIEITNIELFLAKLPLLDRLRGGLVEQAYF